MQSAVSPLLVYASHVAFLLQRRLFLCLPNKHALQLKYHPFIIVSINNPTFGRRVAVGKRKQLVVALRHLSHELNRRQQEAVAAAVFRASTRCA